MDTTFSIGGNCWSLVYTRSLLLFRQQLSREIGGIFVVISATHHTREYVIGRTALEASPVRGAREQTPRAKMDPDILVLWPQPANVSKRLSTSACRNVESTALQ